MRSRRDIRFKNAALALVVLLLTGLTACGSGLRTFTDPTFDYTVSYPAAWVAQPGGTSEAAAGSAPSGTVTIYDPQGATIDGVYADLAMIMVYRLNFTVTDPWAPNIKTQMEGLVTQLQGQLPDMQMEQNLAQTTAAGLKGYSASYTFTKGDTPMRATLYFLFDGDKEFELEQQATLAHWEDAETLLDDIVGSFRPGKG